MLYRTMPIRLDGIEAKSIGSGCPVSPLGILDVDTVEQKRVTFQERSLQGQCTVLALHTRRKDTSPPVRESV